MTFVLEGLPEGMLGVHEVKASSSDQLISMHPELRELAEDGKLEIVDGTVSGFAACDG